MRGVNAYSSKRSNIRIFVRLEKVRSLHFEYSFQPYFLLVNNNRYLSNVVDNIIFGISVPDYPIIAYIVAESRLYDHFGIFVYFVYFIFI